MSDAWAGQGRPPLPRHTATVTFTVSVGAKDTDDLEPRLAEVLYRMLAAGNARRLGNPSVDVIDATPAAERTSA